MASGIGARDAWIDPGGSKGRSLSATATGGVKEKTLIAEVEDGSVRFQGESPIADETTYFDRTTLTPLPCGRVRQHIEVSPDRVEWRSTFGATYVRRS